MCAHSETAEWIANLLNVAVEGKIHLNDIGDGTLIPLQKPGKPRGPLSNLRPVVLLNGIRKLLSLILLKRFSPYANSYIPATQAGFRKGHSCADIFFAKRLICSMALLTDTLKRDYSGISSGSKWRKGGCIPDSPHPTN